MENYGIIDLHCDTIGECFMSGSSLRNRKGHINTEKLKAGGAMAQCFALFIATDGTGKGRPEVKPENMTPWELYNAMLETYEKEISANEDVIRKAFCKDDILKNHKDGYISTLLTVEDGIAVDGKPERIEKMYADGVRMMALTWNYENSIGFPNSADPEKHALGLKKFGKEAVELMNELGMVVDVSHLSEGGFRDVADISKKPFAASHSCARALCGHQRNLTDDQLRILADRGGIVGINFNGPFLRDNINDSRAEDIVRHMKHIRNVAGTDVLAWGSDFDGIDSRLDFEDYAGFPKILRLMEKDFTPAETEKICSGNFLRLFE